MDETSQFSFSIKSAKAFDDSSQGSKPRSSSLLLCDELKPNAACQSVLLCTGKVSFKMRDPVSMGDSLLQSVKSVVTLLICGAEFSVDVHGNPFLVLKYGAIISAEEDEREEEADDDDVSKLAKL